MKNESQPMAKKTTYVRLEPEVIQKLDEVAKEQNKKRSRIIRLAIQEYLNRLGKLPKAP